MSARREVEPAQRSSVHVDERLGVACVLAAMVLVVLSAASVNVVLASLASAFAVDPARAVRVVGAYQLGLVMALLPCAALGQRFGARRVFVAGVALFTVAAAGCAVAPTFVWLVCARFAQGLGGAAVMALGIALVSERVARARLPEVIAYNALAVALSSAAGPTLGALVLAKASWSWVFAMSVPLGALVLAGSRWLPHAASTSASIDVTSVSLSAIAFGAGFVGVESLASQPRAAVLLLVLASSSGGLLYRRERPKRAPMVPFDLLERGAFKWAVLASIACFAAQASAMIAFPFHVQRAFGGEALRAGLLLTPWPVCVAVTAPIAAQLSKRVSTAALCASGAGVLAIASATMALLPEKTSVFVVVGLVSLCGVGFGLFQVPNNRTMLLSAPEGRSVAAGAMQATARLTGQTLGAVVVSLLWSRSGASASDARSAFAFAAIAGLASALASLRRARRE